MKKHTLRIFIPIIAVVALLLGAAMYYQSGAGTTSGTAKATGFAGLNFMQKKLVDGFLSSELTAQSAATHTAGQHNYFPTSDSGCSQNRGSNIKVNQNCLNVTDADLQGRGQANNETAIAQDPNNPNHILATSNDYRRGDGNCFNSYSLDGGQSWTDAAVPMGFTRGTAFGGVQREYWHSGGDPSVAWDTRGNAYFSCMVFQRGPGGVTNNPDQSSAVYVYRSTGNFGASWNFPGRPVVETFVTGTTPNLLPLEDKPYMTVDNHTSSPFRDRIYVTYTEFAADGSAYIWESHSNDYGETFSPRVLVSRNSRLCANTFGFGTAHGNCNENQFSQPFTSPDGSLYVVYSNFNNAQANAKDNHSQVLLSKSVDGGRSFLSPVKVADYYDLPDCAAFQGGLDAGRSCVPEKGSTTNSIFRASNYPSGAVNPKNTHQVLVTIGSYINTHSNEHNGCVPQGFSTFGTPLYKGVKTPGACNNDILVSVSRDSGAAFTGGTTGPRNLTSVNQTTAQATTDQFFQWAVFSNTGKFAVSYFDRQYGQDELSGSSDFSLSGVDDPFSEFKTVRVTTSSMPPPTQFPDVNGASVFYGDYTGLSAINGVAYPLWMDTRGKDRFLCPGTGVPGVPPAICTATEPNGVVANDQDIYTQAVNIP